MTTCAWCSDEISTDDGRRRYCSIRCRNRASEEKRKVPCTSCGAGMWSSRTTAAEPRCLPCRRSAPGYKPARREPVMPESRLCLGCGGPFEAVGLKAHCSVECRRAARNRRRRAAAPNAIPEIVLFGLAYRFGAFAPKLKSIKCRVPVGVVASCPNCDAIMGCVSPDHRICRSCATEVVFNPEEVEAASAGLISA